MRGPGVKALYWLGSLFLFASSALCDGPCSIDFPHDANPTNIADEDICNFHQVDADAYRGGRPRPGAYAKLAELGIRTIVSLEETEHAEKERAILEDLNRTLPPEKRIDFIAFPINTSQITLTGLSDQQVRSLFDRLQNARKPVFIHCYLGKDRTGGIVALYRMLRQEESYRQAYDEALHYKFDRLDFGLKRTLDRYKDPTKLKSLPRP